MARIAIFSIFYLTLSITAAFAMNTAEIDQILNKYESVYKTKDLKLLSSILHRSYVQTYNVQFFENLKQTLNRYRDAFARRSYKSVKLVNRKIQIDGNISVVVCEEKHHLEDGAKVHYSSYILLTKENGRWYFLTKATKKFSSSVVKSP
jgi:hypothetical protein